MSERIFLGDVVRVIHGKNQRDVESEEGAYPIYGSGGIIGRANDYLCPAHTVIVGRKGTINHPIYVDEPFWNVDTAFGLVADKDRLLPRYLFHFCSHFDFMKLNTAATIPSLTKKSIQGICFMLPSVSVQRVSCAKLDFVLSEIDEEQSMLESFDELVKSRFVEMFGDPDTNPLGFDSKPGSKLFKIGNGKAKPNAERFEEGVPAYGGNGISWYTNEALVEHATIVIGRVGRHCGNTRLVEEPCWVTDNAMFIKDFKDASFDLTFLSWLMEIIGFNRFADKGDLWKITQKPFMEYSFYVPPLALQQEFTALVQQVDKLKFETQQAIDKLQMLYDSLAQEYFAIE